MLKIRSGALPVTEVKIPQFPPGKPAQPLPQTEDGEVIRALIGRRRDAGYQNAEGVVHAAHEIKAPIRTDVHTCVGVLIQSEWERQTDEGIAVIDVITRIGSARHDRI